MTFGLYPHQIQMMESFTNRAKMQALLVKDINLVLPEGLGKDSKKLEGKDVMVTIDSIPQELQDKMEEAKTTPQIRRPKASGTFKRSQMYQAIGYVLSLSRKAA